jgi:hypothetical protein
VTWRSLLATASVMLSGKQEASHMPEDQNRKLTDDEKQKVHHWALERERKNDPDSRVTITVADELKNGLVH